MTEKIFEQDAYCREFEAVVVSCEPYKGKYRIELDRTAFYPEGGGQPGDTGTLTNPVTQKTARIADTQYLEDSILHYSDQPLAEGIEVVGRIDWERRFDHMQNHSGEHIVSGLIHQSFGYNNVGFHMGSDFITIDLDGELTSEQLSEIEYRANRIVWDNLETEITNYTQEQAAFVSYRSKKELSGTVRVVVFPGADSCACCGTHVKRTGEIGLIKLLSCEKFKGGVRIELLCGRKAYLYMNSIFSQNRAISVSLSARPLTTAEAVDRLKQQQSTDSFKVLGLQKKLFSQIACSYDNADRAILFEEDLQADDVRRLTVELMDHCKGICMVLSGNDQAGYKYCIGQKNADLRQLVKDMNGALSGRGGGKPFFAQGSFQAEKEQIRKVLSDLPGMKG